MKRRQRVTTRRAPYGRRSTTKTVIAPQGADPRRRHKLVASLRTFMRGYGLDEAGRAAREDFARRCGTSLPYLIQVGLGNRLASLEMAIRITRASHGLVPISDLYEGAEEFVDMVKLAAPAAAETTSTPPPTRRSRAPRKREAATV